MRALHFDRSGALSIGTETGWLTRFDVKTGDWLHFRHDPLDPESLGPGRILAIHEDDRGTLWVGTWGGGLNLLRRSGQGRSAPDFGRASGDAARTGPPVVLTSVRKLNRDIPAETDISRLGRIELAHDEATIAFEFAVLDYNEPKRNRFSYRVEGLHQQWIDLGVKRTLRVRGADSEGRWSGEALSLRLVVTPPFWQTAWFRVASSALLLGLVSALLRTRSIRSRNLLLEVMNADLSREIAERRKAEAEREAAMRCSTARRSGAESMSSSASPCPRSAAIEPACARSSRT